LAIVSRERFTRPASGRSGLASTAVEASADVFGDYAELIDETLFGPPAALEVVETRTVEEFDRALVGRPPAIAVFAYDERPDHWPEIGATFIRRRGVRLFVVTSPNLDDQALDPERFRREVRRFSFDELYRLELVERSTFRRRIGAKLASLTDVRSFRRR
jgi:hypothetical protein